MKTLEQIRNEIAIKYNAKDWDDYLLFMIRLKTTSKRMTVVFDEIAETYAKQFTNIPLSEKEEPKEQSVTDEDIVKEAKWRFTNGHGSLDRYSAALFIRAIRWYQSKSHA